MTPEPKQTPQAQRPAARGRLGAYSAGAVLLVLVIVAVVYVLRQGAAQGLMVYVGSSMRRPMEQCAKAYQDKTGVHVTPSYADSGEVLAQIKQSGMGELAVLHEPYLTLGKREGWAVETFVVANMTPVLIVPEGNPMNVRGLKDFLRPDLKVGLTDYRYATSGAIARRAMENAAILDQVLARTPPPYENKSSGQVASQVVAGALDLAIVWDAVAAQSADELDVIPIEPEFMPPTYTDPEGVSYHNGRVPVGLFLLSTAKQPDAARKFVDFVLSPQGQAVWKANGYVPASPDQAP